MLEIFKRPDANGNGIILQVRLSPNAYLEAIRVTGVTPEEHDTVVGRLDVRPGDPVSEKASSPSRRRLKT